MKTRKYSWRQFERDCRKIAEALKTPIGEYYGGPAIPNSSPAESGRIKSLYGIPRGGMVVAVRLSYILEIPIVEFSQISETTLIVDDVLGSGRTAREVLRKVPSKQLASLVYAEDAELPPGLTTFMFGRKVPGNIFIKMPWAPEDNLH